MDFAATYREGRERMLELARDIDPDDATRPVPACPEWTVKDVYAHQAGVCADILGGRIDGVATDPWTARQVAERADRSLKEICAEWEQQGREFDVLLGAIGEAMDPRLVIDQWTHEQDVRGALGRPGSRDLPVVGYAVGAVMELRASSASDPDAPPIRLVTQSGEWALGTGEPRVTLRTSDFELMRVTMGRRTREQMAALDWDGDPGPAIDNLYVFGPATAPVLE
jgi:uncharacterized protein (TIGR03083 family)